MFIALLSLALVVLSALPAGASPLSHETRLAVRLPFREYLEHRNAGDYEAARAVLEGLLARHPQDAAYQAAMGVLLLRGLRNPEAALPYFERAIALDPHDPSAYTDLGDAYRRLGKPEQAEGAYRDAIRIVPYATWTDHARSELKVLRFAREGSLLADWLLIGPFPPGAYGRADETFPIPIGKADLAAWDPAPTGVSWVRPFQSAPFGFVDFNEALGHHRKARAFALAHLWSPEKRDAVFRVGSDDQMRLWVNGELAHEALASRPAEVDQDAVDVTLRKGWNEVVVEVENGWGDWGFFFRVTDRRFNVLTDVFFDATRRDPAVQRAIWRARMPKILGWSVAALVALNLMFLVLVLALRYSRNMAITRAKADFLSHVSHDLKTPLASIKMFAESLAMGGVDEAKRREYLRTIADEIERLTELIENFLDFSRMERGSMTFEAEAQDLAAVVGDVVKRFTTTHEGAVAVQVEYGEALPLVRLNERLFSRAVSNLLDNACKYAPDGKEISVRAYERDGGAVLEVRDFGPGVGPEEKQKIFDKFYRGAAARDLGVAGTGIGLAFVKHIVEQHGGTIEVLSPEGGGTCFRITLAAAR